MNELEVLDAVEAASKGKQKQQILRDNASNPKLHELLDAALNFKRKFHIKKFEDDSLIAANIWGTNSHKILMGVLQLLETRSVTGHAAIQEVEDFLENCSELEQKWYSRIIRKDLKSDFGISTANKAGFKIPEFKVQLAKDGMLCKTLEKICSKLVFLSPKLDGYRCVAEINDGNVILLSRNGTHLKNFKSVEKSLIELCPTGHYVFDGEIMSDDFNSMQKTAFSSKKGTVVGDVVYHIFDMIPYDEWAIDNFKTNAGERYKQLGDFFTTHDLQVKTLGNLRYVQHHKIDAPSLKEIKYYEEQCVKAGFEGCMLNPDIPYYRGKPSNKMLKFKTFHTWDCPIIALYSGEKGTKYEKMLGGVTVLQENGITCDVGSGFSDEEREHIWQNRDQFVDRVIEVKYQELSEKDRMRFPVKTRWRTDKE